MLRLAEEYSKPAQNGREARITHLKRGSLGNVV
jgi:hypothetical protein